MVRIQFEGGVTATVTRFVADMGYLTNKWKENVNGEGYLDNGRLAGRPDLQQRVRDIVTELAPRIDAVETEFANKYNWTRDSGLNSTYQSAPPAQNGVKTAPHTGAASDLQRDADAPRVPIVDPNFRTVN